MKEKRRRTGSGFFVDIGGLNATHFEGWEKGVEREKEEWRCRGKDQGETTRERILSCGIDHKQLKIFHWLGESAPLCCALFPRL
jgi:hypothetical protein